MRLVRTSLTRNLPPQDDGWGTAPVPRARWRDGDFVVGEVGPHAPPGPRVESVTGRLQRVGEGDLVVGALGARRATLEAVGDWRDVGDDLALTTLTRAGVLGRCTSSAPWVRPLMASLAYRGHLTLAGRTIAMSDAALPRRDPGAGLPPTVLLIGSSMSAGKTTAAAVLIRRAARRGMRVAGAKLVGVGRYADILAMRDAGAETVVDFVDAGLPSTIAPPATTLEAVHRVLGAVAAAGADLLVAEAGASPLEPYGGDLAAAALGDAVVMTVLCSSDAYAVRGAMDAFGTVPDLVAGRVAATSAGAELVARLTGLEALDVTDPLQGPRIDELLARALDGGRPR